MKGQKLSALAACLLLAVSLSIPAAANQTPNCDSQQTQGTSIQVQPRYSYTTNATTTLNILGSTATIKASVKGTSEVTKVVITTRFYQDGKEIASWSKTATGANAIASISQKVPLTKSGSYQAVTSYTAYGKSGSESDSVSSTTKKYTA